MQSGNLGRWVEAFLGCAMGMVITWIAAFAISWATVGGSFWRFSVFWYYSPMVILAETILAAALIVLRWGLLSLLIVLGISGFVLFPARLLFVLPLDEAPSRMLEGYSRILRPDVSLIDSAFLSLMAMATLVLGLLFVRLLNNRTNRQA